MPKAWPPCPVPKNTLQMYTQKLTHILQILYNYVCGFGNKYKRSIYEQIIKTGNLLLKYLPLDINQNLRPVFSR